MIFVWPRITNHRAACINNRVESLGPGLISIILLGGALERGRYWPLGGALTILKGLSAVNSAAVGDLHYHFRHFCQVSLSPTTSTYFGWRKGLRQKDGPSLQGWEKGTSRWPTLCRRWGMARPELCDLTVNVRLSCLLRDIAGKLLIHVRATHADIHRCIWSPCGVTATWTIISTQD